MNIFSKLSAVRIPLKVVAPIGILAFGFVTLAVLYAARPEPEKKAIESRITGVRTAAVVQRDIPVVVHTQGEVRSRVEVDLVAEVGGRIVKVSPEFNEGGQIAADTPLLWIDDSDYRLALIQAEAQVAEANMRLEQVIADADVARKQLRGDKNASALALKKPHITDAKAKLRAAEANLEKAQLDLERCQLSLPFPARVKETKVDIGQSINVGNAVARVFATDMAEIRIPLTSTQLASLNLPIGYRSSDQKVAVELTATISATQYRWQGILARVDAAIDNRTRLIYATVEVANPYQPTAANPQPFMPLAVGMFVKAAITGPTIEAALVIPREGLRNNSEAYVIEDGKLVVRQLNVVFKNNQEAIITEGLQAGDQVIVSVLQNPLPGMSVRSL